MSIAISPETQKLIQSKLESGRYPTAEDVIQAALAALEQQEAFGDFEPGELDELIAEGERSIARGGVVDSEAVFNELRERSARQRAEAR